MFFREKQVYLILRELHKWEQDDVVKGVIENLVHILISDEPRPGMDNLEEIKLDGQEHSREGEQKNML